VSGCATGRSASPTSISFGFTAQIPISLEIQVKTLERRFGKQLRETLSAGVPLTFGEAGWSCVACAIG
jgi:hypothetical protein